MKDRLKNLRAVVGHAGIWSYLGCPLLPFWAFVCVPTALSLVGFTAADIVFTALLCLTVAVFVINIFSLARAMLIDENHDRENRCFVIFLAQGLCIIIGAIAAKLVGVI